MKLDYGTLLSPHPIPLLIGTLKKPTLNEISRIGFTQYDVYRYFMNVTPATYYTEVKAEEGGKDKWLSMTYEEQNTITLFDVMQEDEQLASTYESLFNFFFKEEVIYKDGVFLLLNDKFKPDAEITEDMLCGYINVQFFAEVISFIRQISCVSEPESDEHLKFKNETARKLYKRMQNAKKKDRKGDKNFSIPNIISSVANRHPSLNVSNIWSLTVFQLLDAFERLRIGEIYNIQALRVSVWGDEKNQFKDELWYQNNFD